MGKRALESVDKFIELLHRQSWRGEARATGANPDVSPFYFSAVCGGDRRSFERRLVR